MKFYLGIHNPAWLRGSEVPMFVSHNRLKTRKSPVEGITCEWALDSGGFTEISTHGKWTVHPDEYIEAVREYQSWGGLQWAAPQDWMVEPHMIELTGKSVREHQELTVDNFLYLRDNAQDLPFIPVLQGWEMPDYIECYDMYHDAGIRLQDYDTVGVGSVCRRSITFEIEQIMHQLWDKGLNLHGFGVKTKGLKNYSRYLSSADSLAWSYQGRFATEKNRCSRCFGKKDGLPKSDPMYRPINCANCLEYGMRWRENLITTAPKVEDQRIWL